MSLDQFLDRVPAKEYNCFDFVREVWLHLTNVDLLGTLTRLQGDFNQRKVTIEGMKARTPLLVPKTPCIVLMQRRKLVPHVGIWIDGKVFHLKNNGVQFQPLTVAQGYFKHLSFYQ